MTARNQETLDGLVEEIRACRICAAELPMGPRPVLRARATARILIVGQAPGLRVHETGIPWNDPSGDRLRQWMGLTRDEFYDESRIAIVPMGLCYPGRNPRGGDLAPRPECAQHWFQRIHAHLPAVELTLLCGQYAQRHYLRDRAEKTLTETVRAWRDYFPAYLPLPHPSWRNNAWIARNPWFAKELLPFLRQSVQD